jgi:hypothetical protein
MSLYRVSNLPNLLTVVLAPNIDARGNERLQFPALGETKRAVMVGVLKLVQAVLTAQANENPTERHQWKPHKNFRRDLGSARKHGGIESVAAYPGGIDGPSCTTFPPWVGWSGRKSLKISTCCA